MNLYGEMSYAPELCPTGTGCGQYGNSANPNTHVIYCIHCDTECTLPSVCCPACLLWHGIDTSVPERGPDYYPSDPEPDTRSFTIFTRLPEQLRYMIWREALPGPRIVHLRRRLLKLPDGKTRSFGYESPSTIPMAYVCRESYMVALEEYSQVFSGGLGSIPQTWFNFNRDTLYLDCGPITEHLQVEMNCLSWTPEFEKVKRLAIFSYPLETYGYPQHIRAFLMHGFILESWIYYILTHGSITNVIFINKHHSSTTYDDLTLIDLQNPAASLSVYEKPYDPIAERTLKRRQESFRNRHSTHNVKLGPSLHGIQSLDTMRRQDAAVNGGVASFEMPSFECMTLTTRAMERKLKEAVVGYEVKKICYERRLRERKQMLNGMFLPQGGEMK